MEKAYLINITNKLYQLTLFFPKKEPLRYKMRELADEILVNSAYNPKSKEELSRTLEIIDSLFDVAKAQNWVKIQDIFEVQDEYAKIRDTLKKALEKTEETVQLSSIKAEIQQASINNPSPTNSNRKQRIIDILKEKDKIQVWEVKKILPEVTKRTLRRDFESLLKQGLIERMGERNNTFYRLIA